MRLVTTVSQALILTCNKVGNNVRCAYARFSRAWTLDSIIFAGKFRSPSGLISAVALFLAIAFSVTIDQSCVFALTRGVNSLADVTLGASCMVIAQQPKLP